MDINSDEKNEKDYTNQSDAIGKFTGFFLFRNLINKYNNAKDAPDEERKQIKKYGVMSVILALISIGISLSCLFSTFMDFQFFGFSYVLMLLVYILGGIIICFILAIYSFVFAVMQVRLNRKAVGIFGIIFSVIGIITSLSLIFFLIF